MFIKVEGGLRNKKMMSEEKWYSSREHFRTEESYEQYKRKMKKKKSNSFFGNIKIPNLKF